MPILLREARVRTFLLLIVICALLAGGTAGGWWAMNYYAPGNVGTPAHAGSVSNGRPEQCTNLNFNVMARSSVKRDVTLDEGDLVRGTFEVNGGFGRVDIFLRVTSPQNLEILASPKAENYDFNFPAKMRGTYTFVFDNRYSLYISKSVGLYYCVEKQLPRS
jgi:hypothetical protein